MALKPEISLMAALATAGVVYGIFQTSLPKIADVRSVEAQNQDIEAAERAATWESAAVVSAISLLAKDPAIFVVGGMMTIVLAWKYRHADMVDPITHRASQALTTVDDVIQAQERDAEPSTGKATVSPMYRAAI